MLIRHKRNKLDCYRGKDCLEKFCKGLRERAMKKINYEKKIEIESIKLKLKNLGDDHDLYVQSDTLLLVDVFENFRNKCIEI